MRSNTSVTCDLCDKEEKPPYLKADACPHCGPNDWLDGVCYHCGYRASEPNAYPAVSKLDFKDYARAIEARAYERAARVAIGTIKELGLSDNPAYIRYEPADNRAKQIASSIRALTIKAK